jgi:uncharacterized YigZ family protein
LSQLPDLKLCSKTHAQAGVLSTKPRAGSWLNRRSDEASRRRREVRVNHDLELRGDSSEAYTQNMIVTLEKRSQAVLKIRDSRFLAFAVPIESPEEARREIEALEDRYPDATHVCYAFRVARGDSRIERCHDAGEPAGSAGAPILSVIQGRGLENLLVAVVRYFGGTKLGVGGLARAYRDAAKAAVSGVARKEQEIRTRLRVTLPLTFVGEARSRISRLGGGILDERYGDAAELSTDLPEEKVEELIKTLADLTRGTARVDEPDRG